MMISSVMMRVNPNGQRHGEILSLLSAPTRPTHEPTWVGPRRATDPQGTRSLVEDVGARRLRQHAQVRRPELLGRRTLRAAALVEPAPQIGPPGAIVDGGVL